MKSLLLSEESFSVLPDLKKLSLREGVRVITYQQLSVPD
jgi:hypothetical protein